MLLLVTWGDDVAITVNNMASYSDQHVNVDLAECLDTIDLGSNTVGAYMCEPLKKGGSRADVSVTDSSSGSEHEDQVSLSETGESDAGDDENNFLPVPSVESWCKCDNCIDMPTITECVCCQCEKMDYKKLRDRVDEAGGKCITYHQGFIDVCLSIHTLSLTLYMYIHDEGPLGDAEPIHEAYRYLAYRNFVRFVWKILGPKVRKVIPSCAVKCIRQAFPSQVYAGFKYPT